jgi:hypothetical protein
MSPPPVEDTVFTNDGRKMTILAVRHDHMLLLDGNEITHSYTLDGKAMSVSGETGERSEHLDLVLQGGVK